VTHLSEPEPIDRWSRSAHPERRCTAHRKTGDRCKNAARLGTTVCDFHGAKAPQVKHKARQRIEEAADRLARELLSMATDPNVAESVRLSAIKDALDRGGLSAKTAVEIEVGPPKPWELIIDATTEVVAGSRAEFRRSQMAIGYLESDRDDLGGDPASTAPTALPSRQAAIPAEPADATRARPPRAGR